MTLREVAEQAIAIHQAHDEAASADAGFDAGEFSGPAHGRMADEEIKALAEENGFTYEQVNQEIERICHEGADWVYYNEFEVVAEDGPPYLIVLSNGDKTPVAGFNELGDAQRVAAQLNQVFDAMEAGEEIKE